MIRMQEEDETESFYLIHVRDLYENQQFVIVLADYYNEQDSSLVHKIEVGFKDADGNIFKFETLLCLDA